MKRTTPITISGQIFYLEEEGFELLRDYLDSLHRYFAGNEGALEILADIEARVAERLVEFRAIDDTGSISPQRVLEIMDGIGRPEDFGDLGGESPALPPTRLRDRRLYRDLDGGLLAGVSSGLATYLSLDANLIRAAFVVGTLFGGAGAILYLVLWAVIPPARTAADRLRMIGTPVTASAIAKLFPGAKALHEGALGADFRTPVRNSANALAEKAQAVLERVVPIVRTLLGIFFLLGGALVTFTICLVGALFLGLPAHYLDPDVAAFLDTVPFRGLLLSGAMTLLIPAALVLAGGIALLRGRRPQHLGFIAVGAVLTFIALLSTAILGTQTGLAWESHTRNDPGHQAVTLTLTPEELQTVRVAGAEISVRVIEGREFEVTVNGRRKEFDRLSYSLTEGILNLEMRPMTTGCVFCDRGVVHVIVRTPDPGALEVQRARGPQLGEGLGDG